MQSAANGQTVIITGANRGIGLELAKLATKKGARVIATARHAAQANDLKKAVGANGAVLSLDISQDSSVQNFVHDLERMGIKSIDLLINNAGIYIDGDVNSIDQLEPEVLITSFDTNAVGPFRVTKALLPLLRKAPSAKIASLSSLMGSMTDNTGGGAYAYRMSKAAVNMFVRSLTVEEREMTVLALHPGWVKTEMGGDRAPLDPEKSAEGLWTVIETATPTDSGKFFNHAGRELPW